MSRQLIGPKFLVLTRGAAVGITISFIAILVALGWLWNLNSTLTDQQHRLAALSKADAALSVQNRKLIEEVCKNEQALRTVFLVFAYSQPNLDPQVVNVITATLADLPERCGEGRGR